MNSLLVDQFFEAFRRGHKSNVLSYDLVPGSLKPDAYHRLEKKYDVRFPKSFIAWHSAYFFSDGDCGMVRLPASNALQPLAELENELNWSVPTRLISQKLYPFAQEGNDAGPLVFDARADCIDDEYPIRWYEHEYGGNLEGLGEIISGMGHRIQGRKIGFFQFVINVFHLISPKLRSEVIRHQASLMEIRIKDGGKAVIVSVHEP